MATDDAAILCGCAVLGSQKQGVGDVEYSIDFGIGSDAGAR